MSIYETIRSCLDREKRGVLATIVRRVGATPRDAGAKVFIEEGGKLFGTIGWGCVEAEAWREAQTILQSGKPRLFHYAMNGQQVEDEGLICGGSLEHLHRASACMSSKTLRGHPEGREEGTARTGCYKI